MAPTHRLIAVVLVLHALSSQALPAQRIPAWVRLQATLRVGQEAPASRVVGQFTAQDADSVYLRVDGARRALPQHSLQSVEVAREHGNKSGAFMILGGLAGLVGGIIVRVAAGESLEGTGGVAAAGAAIGAAAGYAIGRPQRTPVWSNVPLDGPGRTP